MKVIWFLSGVVLVMFLFGCGSDPTQAEIVTEEDIPALTRALENPKLDPIRRGKAASRLGQTRSAKAIKPLIKAASDEKYATTIRISAIDALLEIGDPSILTDFATLAKDKSVPVRQRIMMGLSHFKGKKKEVEPILLEGLRDSAEEVRSQSLKSFNELGLLPPLADLERLLNDSSTDIAISAAEMVYRKREEEGAGSLVLKGLQNQQVGVLKYIIAAAGELGLQDAVERLIELTKRKEHVLREESAKALGKIHDLRAVDALTALLEDEYPDIAAAAAKALGEIRGLKAVDHLIRALEHSDDAVRMNALEALVAMQDSDERCIEKVR
ncbi:MAG: HEAT repeat domain-containing protein [Planctomycetota bacterium]|nr:HEAT repeat domain-containing protein [Planctomycetota bacterium]